MARLIDGDKLIRRMQRDRRYWIKLGCSPNDIWMDGYVTALHNMREGIAMLEQPKRGRAKR